ncbi:MAG: hypothetical protein JO051_03895, partial [Acidobacteriaceae bacterium]|nr:hypothetical protein [Acidobacteriaceae bacterium]
MVTPLRVPEIQTFGWSSHYTWVGFWQWVSQALDASPLAYLIQLPLVLLFGASRLGPRIPALLFAVGSCFLFLRLINRAAPKQRYAGLFLFMLLPVQLFAVTSPTQYDAAVFFVLLATLALFDLRAQPGYRNAAYFALATAACLFTDHHAGVPIAGAVLFLLRFSPRPQERKAVWFALGAFSVAVALYAPFYVWVRSYTNPFWLTEPGLSVSGLAAMSAVDWAFAFGVLLMIAGAILSAVVSFRLPVTQITRRLTLFCLFGSFLVTILVLVVTAVYGGGGIAYRELLFAAPSAVVLFYAVLEWLAQLVVFRAVRIALVVVGVALVVVSGLIDVELIGGPEENLALEATHVTPELTGDSCVVFVSEKYSKPLFLVFQPQLDAHECQEFFHHRIVLASHPYVHPDQQADAESYFRGLNY